MPFQINLDSAILETASQFPYILGNLMVNDYLRGLDPLKDNRTPEEAFLARFGDGLSTNQRLAVTSHRSITQQSSSVEGFANDPRGAGLVYSKWLNKWYIGMGRCRQIFACLMDHIGLMKGILVQDNIDPTEVFTQSYEEAIIRSFCRLVLPDETFGEDAIKWYRIALPHNKVHCLELAFGEKILPQWNAGAIAWKDPGVEQNHQGVTVPRRQVDRYADRQSDFLRAIFGRDSSGTPDELEKQPVGRLIQRVLEAAIGKAISVGLANETPFNLKRTYISELGTEEMYSPMVVIASYCNLEEVNFVPVQPSMSALEGIALCHPTEDLHNHALETRSDIRALETEFSADRPWAGELMYIKGVRTDMWRCLKASGFTTRGSATDFAQTFEGGHFEVEAKIMYPAECLHAHQLFGFWPHPNPKSDRGSVPIQCIEVLNAMNGALLFWKNQIRGFESITSSGRTSAKNSNAPAPIRPEAVRPQIVEVVEAIESETGKSVGGLHEVDITEKKRPRSDYGQYRSVPGQTFSDEASLRQPTKRVKFARHQPVMMVGDEKEPEVQQYKFLFPVFVICILGFIIYRS